MFKERIFAILYEMDLLNQFYKLIYEMMFLVIKFIFLF